MKTKIFVIAASLLLSTAAFAQPGNNGGGNGGCGVGQQTNGCGGTIGGAGGSAIQGQAQGQIQGQAQGQAQSLRNSVRNTNLNANVNANRNANRNSVRSTNANTNTAHGGSASSRSSARSYNAGNNQSMSYNEARDRRQAPGISAQFSSVAGNPCEGAPFGLGGSGPGFGALFQIPRESGNCWSERQAILLHGWGYTNAAIAVLSGNPVGVAVQNNPIVYRVRARAVRAKN